MMVHFETGKAYFNLESFLEVIKCFRATCVSKENPYKRRSIKYLSSF